MGSFVIIDKGIAEIQPSKVQKILITSLALKNGILIYLKLRYGIVKNTVMQLNIRRYLFGNNFA